MKRCAIAADIFANDIRVTERHKVGFNVAYADGSCEWVLKTALINDLPKSIQLWGNPSSASTTTIPANDFESTSAAEGDNTSAANDPLMQAIWQMLDQRGK
jgi:prepilin-type processing-associated H-X9-DG protein